MAQVGVPFSLLMYYKEGQGLVDVKSYTIWGWSALISFCHVLTVILLKVVLCPLPSCLTNLSLAYHSVPTNSSVT